MAYPPATGWVCGHCAEFVPFTEKHLCPRLRVAVSRFAEVKRCGWWERWKR